MCLARRQCAKGAMSMQAWSIAPGIQSHHKQALKARFSSTLLNPRRSVHRTQRRASVATRGVLPEMCECDDVLVARRRTAALHRAGSGSPRRRHNRAARKIRDSERQALRSISRYLLNLFDELSLGNSSRQRRDNMNVISNAAYVHQIGTEIAAERRQISVYARPHLDIEPRLAILRAKNDMKDDFAKRLRHGANDDRTGVASESRF